MNTTGITGQVGEPKRNHRLFEEIYTELRYREHWLCADDEVAVLPCMPADHPHYKEWLDRKASGRRLLRHLRRKRQHLNILEVGCGNGWLSYRLAGIRHARVTGIDINPAELNQARRVFAFRSNLQFISGDIRSGILWDYKFDEVVFAASLEYFPSAGDILQFVRRHLLKPGGEIHILDTPFYTARNIQAARLKTIAYYREAGVPEMIAYHFHHTLEEAASFPCKIMYDPGSVVHRLAGNHDPFYWICIG